MRDLDGRVALVTGGGGGIGRETVSRLAEFGARVVVVDQDAAGGADTVEQAGGDAVARFVQADVADLPAMLSAVAAAVDRWGRLDIACNNAAVGLNGPDLADVSVEQFEHIQRVNVTGVFVSMKAEMPAMLPGGGSVINISSNLGEVAVAGQSAYVASKHAVIGLTRAAALEYSARGVRVNAVLPGVIRTPPLDRRETASPGTLQTLSSRHPIGRLGTPREVADAVVWLASGRSSFVTGAEIVVDGGYLAQ
jgi:NAD(P)-dependent dehydrogenase (short-subunit alcohol dehydrogenase family)